MGWKLNVCGAFLALAGAAFAAFWLREPPGEPHIVTVTQPMIDLAVAAGADFQAVVSVFDGIRGLKANTSDITKDTNLAWMPKELIFEHEEALEPQLKKPFDKAYKEMAKKTKMKKSGEWSMRNYCLLVLGLAVVKARKYPPLLAAYMEALPPEPPKIFDSLPFHQRETLEKLLGEPKREGVGEGFYNGTHQALHYVLEKDYMKTAWVNMTGTDPPKKQELEPLLRYVVSRTITTPEGDQAIAPLLDLMNIAPKGRENVKLECVSSNKSLVSGCQIVAKRDLDEGEQLLYNNGLDSDAYYIATMGMGFDQPVSAFRLRPMFNASDRSQIPAKCKRYMMWGFHLDSREPHGFNNDDLACVLMANFSSDEIKEAKDAKWFAKKSGSARDLTFKRPKAGTKQAKWRNIEDKAIEETYKVCKKHRQRLHQQTYDIGRLGNDKIGLYIAKQLRLDIKLLRGCEAFMMRMLNATVLGER
eukprot:gnl/MRDRNA2_/MRDRNA2_30151_c0_seq1.p1 gnl/MRDRNA2_/MRDRNA2_30151_c0~~gnl/MRDRNA2_/MRDRNA2_30151_c0_seq1.p1  ORF type:complete len:473 (+),score=105.23 gnl/MRDRNA2_/MRDRNA2_30151_c0_seq1:161-1579(+)